MHVEICTIIVYAFAFCNGRAPKKICLIPNAIRLAKEKQCIKKMLESPEI